MKTIHARCPLSSSPLLPSICLAVLLSHTDVPVGYVEPRAWCGCPVDPMLTVVDGAILHPRAGITLTFHLYLPSLTCYLNLRVEWTGFG